MAERRISSSWPWRKKSSGAASKSSSAAQDAVVDDAVLLAEALAQRRLAEEASAALKEELLAAQEAITAKEATVKQHEKVAEDAVSGWEKAEAETTRLKQELQAAALQKSSLADRVAQLDAALKECTRQMRQVKEEEAAKMAAAMAAHGSELEAARAAGEAKYAALERKMAESDARASALARSLQERGRMIGEANDAIAKAEEETALLKLKLAAADKEMASLKYELHVATKELEIRNEEVEFVKKSADAAHRQHLDNVKKMAGLEADVGRLRNLLKKKLPGPAALAQMRKEVENLPASPPPAYGRENGGAVTPDPSYKRRGSRSPSGNYAFTAAAIQNGNGAAAASLYREMEMLRDRMLSVEEENNLLKEALSRRHGELAESRLLCAKTATRLSIAEEELESALLHSGGGARQYSDAFDANSTSVSLPPLDDDTTVGAASQEVSCAESWASALISQLAHFKKESPISASTAHCRTLSDSLQQGEESIVVAGADVHPPPDSANLVAEARNGAAEERIVSGEASISPEATSSADQESPSSMPDFWSACSALKCNLRAMAELLEKGRAGRESAESSGDGEENVVVLMAAMVEEARKQVWELERGIGSGQSRTNTCTEDGADAYGNKTNAGETVVAAGAGNEGDPIGGDQWEKSGSALKYMCAVSIGGLSRALSEVMAAVEQAVELVSREAEDGGCRREAGSSEEGRGGEEEEERKGRVEELRRCKGRVVEGRSSVLELLLRMGLVLSGTRAAAALREALEVEVRGEVEVPAAAAAAAAEVGKWKASVERLEGQLEEERKRCQELEHKLQQQPPPKSSHHPNNAPITNNNINNTFVQEEGNGDDNGDDDGDYDYDDPSASLKERELSEAKEKLVECQRTIMVLGKKLKALSMTSPKGRHSPAGSFDTTMTTTSSSMESGGGPPPNPNGGGVYYYNNNNNNNNYYNNNQQQQQFMVPLPESLDDNIPSSHHHSARYHHQQQQQQQQQRFHLLQSPSTPPPRSSSSWSLPPMDDHHHHHHPPLSPLPPHHPPYALDHPRLSGPILAYHHHLQYAAPQLYGNGVSDGGAAAMEHDDIVGNPPSLALTVYQAPPTPLPYSPAARDSSPSALSRLFKSKKKR